MRKFLFYIVILLPLVFVSGEIFAQQSAEPVILRKLSSEEIRDARLEMAIISDVGINEDDVKQDTRYYYNYVDLNGDKVPEVLVYVFGGYFCGTGGCDAYLFGKTKNRYTLLNHFEPVRNPIIVSLNKTNGWNDLIFFNRGGGIIEGYYSVCSFDGKSYPENPTVVDNAPTLKTRTKGILYLAGIGYGDSGLKFQLVN